MLKGVISREEVAPFTLGMTTKRWINEVPVQLVNLSDLWASQEGVYFSAILGEPSKPVGGDPLPHVVELPDGRLVIEDGHSRIMRAALRGSRMTIVRLKKS